MSSNKSLKNLTNEQASLPATTLALETSGDLRRLMKNIAVGVMQGDLRVDAATICVKACEQINVSLYSEIKHAAMIVALGRSAPELGELPLFGGQVVSQLTNQSKQAA